MIRAIKRDYGHALERECREHGVTIKIQGHPCTAILRGEKLMSRPAPKICDCIVLRGNCSFLIELKSTHLDYESIVEQFRSGYRKLVCILRSVSKRPSDVFFVLVAKDYGNRYAKQRLKHGFKIGSKKCRIILAESGDCLDSVAKPRLGVSFSGGGKKS
ncbi:MAG: hypothetical protein OXP12_00075 [Thaumarchaeota archaeon]|nr:hypothetical protein [Nitrososphaerota archaeon]MDE0524995.1 hypothetical protein [Nitrososphaerota archaeon]